MTLATLRRAHRSLIQGFRFANLLLVVRVSGAQWVSAQRVPTLKFARLDLTVLGQIIGKSTHAQVEDALGKMEFFKTGGEGSDAAFCYRSKSRDDDTVVVFCFGALGGWTYLTQISISRSRTLPWPATRCVFNRQFGYYVSHDCESQDELGGRAKPTHERPCEVVDSVDGRFAAEDGLKRSSRFQPARYASIKSFYA